MRLFRPRFVATILVIAIAGRSTAHATDQVVDFTCIGSDLNAVFDYAPNPISVQAGTDRVLFRSGEYSTMVPCAAASNALSIQLSLWGPMSAVSLMYSDWTTPPQGTFCEPGDYTYSIELRGSHGESSGGLPPGTIHVTAPSAGPVPASVTIGVFAERDAGTCVLPATPGPHQAFVCARSHDSAPLGITAAEFRIGGFPASWNVTATPELPAWGVEGDPLGQGVLLASACNQTVYDRIVLYTLDYVVPESALEVTIEVLPATQFGHSRPWVARCDAPQAVYQACAVGGRASIGGSVAPCALATAAKSWSDVRLLYR